MKNNAIIIGAGISGLTTAFLLKKNGLNVTVLEAENEVGGTMKSKRINDYLVELGPNSALETTPLLKQIIDEVGISNEMVYASEVSNKRYIFKSFNKCFRIIQGFCNDKFFNTIFDGYIPDEDSKFIKCFDII